MRRKKTSKKKERKKGSNSEHQAGMETTESAGTVGNEEAAPELDSAHLDSALEDGPPDYQKLYNENNDKLLRVRAEFENYRKRVQREFAEIREQMKISTVYEFLPVYDHFQMALEHADQSEDVETLRQGMQMIQAEFERTLEALGIEHIDAVAREFDHEEHEATAEEPSANVQKGHVIRQWKSGFKANGKLIRPASVVVSSGPVSAQANDKDNE